MQDLGKSHRATCFARHRCRKVATRPYLSGACGDVMYTCDVHMRGVDRTDTMQAERLSSSKVTSRRVCISHGPVYRPGGSSGQCWHTSIDPLTTYELLSRIDPSTGQGSAGHYQLAIQTQPSMSVKSMGRVGYVLRWIPSGTALGYVSWGSELTRSNRAPATSQTQPSARARWLPTLCIESYSLLCFLRMLIPLFVWLPGHCAGPLGSSEQQSAAPIWSCW